MEASRRPSVLTGYLTPFRVANLLLCLTVLPLVNLIHYVSSFASRLPVNDQWDLVPLIASFKEGHPSLAMLFRFHNEHLILIPRLCFASLAMLFTWDNRIECSVTVLLVFVTFLIIWTRTHLRSSETIAGSLAILITSVYLFNTNQWQNWLWGFQLAWPIPVLALTAAVPVIYLPMVFWRQLVQIIAASLIAILSLGNGFVVPLVLAALFLARYLHERNLRTLVLCIVSAGIAMGGVGLLIINRPSTVLYSAAPSNIFSAIVLLAANPFLDLSRAPPFFLQTSTGKASVIAAILFAMIAWFFYQATKRDCLNSAIYTTGAAFALLGIGSVVMIAVSRAGSGLGGVAQSRYIEYAGLLPIGLALMAGVLHEDVDLSHRARLICRLWLGILLTLAIYSLLSEPERLKWGMNMQTSYKPLLELVKVAPVFPNDAELSRICPQRDRYELIRRVAKDRLFRGMIPPDSSVTAQRLVVDDQIGNIDSVLPSAGAGFELKGWSAFLHCHRSVDAAFLAEMQPDGSAHLLVPILSRDKTRPDIEARGGPLLSGWSVHVPPAFAGKKLVLVTFDWTRTIFHRKRLDMRLE